MNQHEVIATYEAILEMSSQMLQAAQRDDWEGLALLEKRCKACVNTLMTDSAPAVLDLRFQQRKAAIIRKVLSDDAKIRELSEPWLAKLGNFLGAGNRERNVQRAYGAMPPRF